MHSSLLRIGRLSAVQNRGGNSHLSASGTSSFAFAQLLEQRLGLPEVRGLEALGEPVVSFREHRVGLIRVRFAGS